MTADREYQSAECFLKLYLFLHSDHVLKLVVLLTICIAADEIKMQSSTVAESVKYTRTTSYWDQFYFS